MTKIAVDADCGNSPKKGILRDVNVAAAENDVETIAGFVAEDVEWTLVGDREIRGRENFVDAFQRMKGENATEVLLDNVITHGKTGAVDGTVTMEGGTVDAFCEVYTFESHAKDAKIQTVTSYVIELEE